ncbi:hypothetical protein K3495_g10191 [Podosphaera aphanis]|nr:hypothetical protein K3495_g10191 [Podosphaera aphanis]
MTSSCSIVSRIWQSESLRAVLLAHLDTHSLCQLRLTTSKYCEAISGFLFAHTRVRFTASFFTRPSRLEALSRIGPQITHLDFSFQHSQSSFLPPLLQHSTGDELRFLYTPPTCAGTLSRVKYGPEKLRQLLTLHYPPLFHAGTNVPAFIRVMGMMPNLQHLTISCQGQEPPERYRRDAVDYALISLRIAVEQASLPHLKRLSLNNVHPAGIHCLRHLFSYGCTPAGSRRWRQITRLDIVMSSWDFSGLTGGREHLLILDDYLRSFSAHVEELNFRWLGHEGPCPFSIISDQIFARQKTQKLFGEVTSSMSPLPPAPQRRSMFFPKLRYVKLCNAKISTKQVTDFVLPHSHTVREFDFINVILNDGGQWEEALAPLKLTSPTDKWVFERSRTKNHDMVCSVDQFKRTHASQTVVEVVDSERPITINATNVTSRVVLEVECESVTARKMPRRQKGRRKHDRTRKKEDVHSNGCHLSGSPSDGSKTAILQSMLLNPFVSGVQRNYQVDAFQQDLADDPDKRASILKRARLAVLKQLHKKVGWTSEGLDQKDIISGHACQESWAHRGKSRIFDRRSILVPLVLSY